VTNDEALLREAVAYGVTYWRGQEFVDRMRVKLPERSEAGTEEEIQISKEEVAEWLALFRARAEARKSLKKRANGASPEKKAGQKAKRSERPAAKAPEKKPKDGGRRR
jgi:hypothetical protein